LAFTTTPPAAAMNGCAIAFLEKAGGNLPPWTRLQL
jgi:hypothetical protein